jgi:hypothetical protein
MRWNASTLGDDMMFHNMKTLADVLLMAILKGLKLPTANTR